MYICVCVDVVSTGLMCNHQYVVSLVSLLTRTFHLMVVVCREGGVKYTVNSSDLSC